MQPDPANSQEALTRLQQQQGQSQNPNQILESQRQNLGVQGAQDTVTGLRGAINNTTKLLKQVAPSVMGRTQGSLVTQAQATRQIGNEQAPIAQNLTDQGQQYGEANQSLSELQRRAQEAASGEYQGQQDRLSYMRNLYNTLYEREQKAEAARQAELDRQEQVRQFNEQLSASKKGGGVGSGFNLGGGESQPQAAQPKMQQRNNGGFNFTDANGTPVSAAKYAQVSGQGIGQVLQAMGQAGDTYAQQVYNQLQGDPFFGKGNANYDNQIKKQYSALFWGA